MRFQIISLTFLLIGCANQAPFSSGQIPSAAEIQYQKFFKRNKNNTHDIEGIWYEYAVGSLYNDRLLLQRMREPNRATWIIIKDKESNRFSVLNANGKNNYFNAYFTPTKNKDIYSFNCDINGTSTKLSSEARMTNKNHLEMEFNAPKSMIVDRYEELEGDIVLHWKIEWIKSFPKN